MAVLTPVSPSAAAAAAGVVVVLILVLLLAVMVLEVVGPGEAAKAVLACVRSASSLRVSALHGSWVQVWAWGRTGVRGLGCVYA